MPAPDREGRLDLSRPRAIHVVGVAGHGMSALAAVLAELGHSVSGTDIAPSRRMDRLALLGVACTVGQRAENVPEGCDAVVISTAVPRTNVEVAAGALPPAVDERLAIARVGETFSVDAPAPEGAPEEFAGKTLADADLPTPTDVPPTPTVTPTRRLSDVPGLATTGRRQGARSCTVARPGPALARRPHKAGGASLR